MRKTAVLRQRNHNLQTVPMICDLLSSQIPYIHDTKQPLRKETVKFNREFYSFLIFHITYLSISANAPINIRPERSLLPLLSQIRQY